MSLLPLVDHDIFIGGKGRAVVVLDMSNKFSILRLHAVMQSCMLSKPAASSETVREEDVPPLISESLTHLHVFRPQSSTSLLATLTSLPDYLLSKPSTHFSANRALGILAISDLSASLWQDRLEAENETYPSGANDTARASNELFNQRYRSVVDSLRYIHDLFSCTIIATNWGLAPLTSVNGQPALRPHLPAAWNRFATVKLVIERQRVSKFGPGVSVEEASGEAAQRWEAVESSGFSVWINWCDSDGWREEVRQVVRSMERRGEFCFRITRGIVVIEND